MVNIYSSKKGKNPWNGISHIYIYIYIWKRVEEKSNEENEKNNPDMT
jgi:hypothetical protein